MNSSPSDAFHTLSPDTVLDALESIGLFSDGRLLALNSYENRVYQVGIEDAAPIVVKFYRPSRWTDAAIEEEHQFVGQLHEQEIPVVPPQRTHGRTLHHHHKHRFAVFVRQGGRAPSLDQAGTLTWIGRFLGRIHAVGTAQSFVERPTLDQHSFGTQARTWLLQSGLIPDELLESWSVISQQALDAVQRCYQRAGDVRLLRLHGDCHIGNLLWTDAGPHFVDFDDSRTGPALQDLWMLLSGERHEMVQQLTELLEGYEDFCEFDQRELYLLEALRTLRLLHYSAWIGMRWDDPAFPAAFPWFGTVRYWQDRILELREQVALMDEAPLWPV